MKAVGYIRVSTSGQAVDGVSLDAQRAKIEAWAELSGYELVAVYEDAGLSGKRADNRAGLQGALNAACAEKAALVVYSLSRLARSTRDAIDIAERLDKAGADLVSLSENIDSTTAAGKMVFRMLAVLAEFERDVISERTRAAMDHKRQQHKRISRRIPFGWDLADDGEMLVENQTERAAVQLMVSLRRDGRSLRAICAELVRRRVRSKTGPIHWSAAVVRAILKREAA